MTNCYLCGDTPATKDLNLKGTFTAHSLAKYPDSDHLCDRCYLSVNIRANYFNPHKGKISILSGRNWSWLWQRDKLIYPVLDESQNPPMVSELPTREILRQWLVNPPTPPFTIAIAESGQKHILFLARPGYSRDQFPVQFEMDTVIVDRHLFVNYLGNVEQLMLLGATKTEILTGQYKSQFLLSNLNSYSDLDKLIETIRGSRLLELVLYVAIKPEKVDTVKVPEIIKTVEKVQNKDVQLSLF